MEYILAALELVVKGASKVYDLLSNGGSLADHPAPTVFESEMKQPSKVTSGVNMVNKKKNKSRNKRNQEQNFECNRV